MSMSTGVLDHYNVSTRKLGDTVRFYEDILGLVNGPRPPFDFPGAWLYSDGHPVLHLNDISLTDKPQAVILAMGTEGYFNWMSKRMCKDAPAYAADKPMLERMAKIGFEPCKPFELAKLDPAVQAALKNLPQTALDKIGANQKSLGTVMNGWQVTKGLGVYGTDYMKRAVVAAFGWPANIQQDAVYPYTTIDTKGESGLTVK